MIIGSLIFSLLTQIEIIRPDASNTGIGLSILMICIIMTGMPLIIPNVLGIALENYKQFAGTSTSVFGCYCYFIVSIMTYVMGLMHNGSLTRLPIFFLLVSLTMTFIFRMTVFQKRKKVKAPTFPSKQSHLKAIPEVPLKIKLHD